jgi:hypothetical protein
MMPVREMNMGEFGAFVASHLRTCSIEVILTGGSCVSIFSNNRHGHSIWILLNARAPEEKR